MQTFERFYSDSYTGEEVVTGMTMVNGRWQKATEFYNYTPVNQRRTSQAVIVGNGVSQQEFNLAHIANHRGGIEGTNRLQSYGCNDIYQTFTPDFLVVTNPTVAEKLNTDEYTGPVYAPLLLFSKYPGKFLYIPQSPNFDTGALATYLACFDGHTKIFLLGFDQEKNPDFYSGNLARVIQTYTDVDFVRVMHHEYHYMHPNLVACPNLRQITFRNFVLEADIG